MSRVTNLPPRIATSIKPRAAPSVTQRTRGSAWMALRSRILKRDGYTCMCQDCTQAGRVLVAHEVDHIRRLADGGTDDPTNLQAINRDCHKRKTISEGGAE